jgi:Fic family protein
VRSDLFESAMRAHVVRAERGYDAFVPPPLPPDLTLTPDLVRLNSRADRAIGFLAGACQAMPNPYLLSRSLMRRESVLSSRIEGTQASLSDLLIYEAKGEPGGPGTDDVREVHNYVAAMEHLLAPDRRLPLSLPLLREAHRILMTGVRGHHATPGEFRTTQNWIGSPGAVLADATYVPPPPERLWECLDGFEKYLHATHELPPLVEIACIHYQFEAIHPFVDGNGRVGRLLITLLLIEWGLLPMPLLDLSAYIEPRRPTYYDGLLGVSTRGDWAGWVRFLLTAIEHQSASVVRRAHRLQQLRDDYRAKLSTARSSGLLLTLVDALFESPVMTIRRAQDLTKVTHRAATLNVEKLVAAGILRELPRPTRPRIFFAEHVIDAIEGRSDVSQTSDDGGVPFIDRDDSVEGTESERA